MSPTRPGLICPTSSPEVAENASSRLRTAEQKLGVIFRDPAILQLALVHSSLLNEPDPRLEQRPDESNERLEFLGDAVLDLLVAEYLFGRFPDLDEGQLTVFRAALVRRETLAKWAGELDLGDLLLVGRGEVQTSGISQRILAGAFEAVVGAIYLDQGLESAREFMVAFLDRDASGVLSTSDLTNYKGLLQEHIQEVDTVLPEYVVISSEGPDHDRNFVIEARHRGRMIGSGSGRSKRLAEQAAARNALAGLVSREADDAPVEDVEI